MDKVAVRNINDLQDALKNVPERSYHIGGYSDSAICLEKTEFGYEVYFAERNKKWDQKLHKTEQEACEDMLGRLEEYMD
ncbi:hypothetical protein bpr_IV052 (plasmid) [Butyrivibrio proteoclasticus B316]|uniref:Uncharacterized protein n=1 Tax=Butyrivibrio proteoclasticus (strain ATCC 51982 / DSM 14932 / B316) TaxID=515622 RepID=E0S4T5_BUTPB|nr:hypothetical protein [Butyrivibrio proteoclasticus]ADL36417.1 hypothetical protein bpr_IV052 [Butyrivibrio proteoclasticus B316]